jgi:predicted GNAT family acetyltransferase
MHQEPLSDDVPASEKDDMDVDTNTAETLTGQVTEVVHHPEERFYELLVDGQSAGLIVYEDVRGRYVFTHTFIAEDYRGRGLSWTLMRGVLEDVKKRRVAATNHCPVLDRFIEKWPEYAPLIDSGNAGISRERP